MRIFAYLFLISAALIWSGNTIVGKLAVGHVSPFTLTFLRWALGFLCLLLFSTRQLRRDWPLLKSKIPLLFAMGIVGFATFNILLYQGLVFTSAIHGAMIQAFVPALIFFLNFVIFSTKPRLLQVFGYTITLVAVILIITQGHIETVLSFAFNHGDFFILAASLAYALYSVFLRLKPDVHWQSLMCVLLAGATVGSFIGFIYEWSQNAAIMPQDMSDWYLVIYAALLASIVAQICFIRGVELIGANQAGLFVNLVPIFATFLSVIILSEQIQVYHLTALGLIIAGLAIAEFGKPKTKRD